MYQSCLHAQKERLILEIIHFILVVSGRVALCECQQCANRGSHNTLLPRWDSGMLTRKPYICTFKQLKKKTTYAWSGLCAVFHVCSLWLSWDNLDCLTVCSGLSDLDNNRDHILIFYLTREDCKNSEEYISVKYFYKIFPERILYNPSEVSFSSKHGNDTKCTVYMQFHFDWT